MRGWLVLAIFLLFVPVAHSQRVDLSPGVEATIENSRAQSGSRPLLEVRLPVGAMVFEGTIDRTLMINSGVQINLSFEMSYDNGMTWTPLCAVGAPGGVVPTGKPTVIRCGLPQPATDTTLIRSVLAVSRGSEVMAVSVRAE